MGYTGRSTELRKMNMRVVHEADSISPGAATDDRGQNFAFTLDKVDEFGRILHPKEAFRQMCWKFHGKAPGRAKREKRLRENIERQKQDAMALTDTPSGAAERMRMAQQVSAAPYVVLDGHLKAGQTRDAVGIYATQDSARGDPAVPGKSSTVAGKNTAGKAKGAQSLTPMLGDAPLAGKRKVELWLK